MNKVIQLIFLSLCSVFGTSANAQEVLYYCSNQDGTFQVFQKNLKTSIVDTITQNPNFNYWWVQLSPNHKDLLMMRTPAGLNPDQFNYANCEMIKSDADGKNSRVIIQDNQNNWFAFGNPQWHPSGNRILMIAQPGGTNDPFHLFTVDTNGLNPKQISSQYSLDGNWSRDGTKIVFIGIDSGGFTGVTDFEVFTANYDYGLNKISSTRQLTSDITRNHDPCFSPDGKTIVFSASPSMITNADLITIDTNGLNKQIIVDDEGIHGGPLDWGSNGQIYYHNLYLSPFKPFSAASFNTLNNSLETLLTATNFSHISPYYANLSLNAMEEHVSPNVIKVFPNPATNRLLIQSSKPIGRFELYNSYGRQLAAEFTFLSYGSTLLNIKTLRAGLYYLKSDFHTLKFIKND